jgi:hypothetical protein
MPSPGRKLPYNVTNHKLITLILLTTLFIFSCKQHDADKKEILKGNSANETKRDSLLQTLNDNVCFISNSLLTDKDLVLKKYLRKYQTDTCGIIVYKDSTLKSDFEGVKNLGDINGNKISDSVFVLPPFNYCDDGDSYVFFDTTLPRLYTDSYCCHPDNLFSIGDIDEDGIDEICIFYSSCASRFKSLIAYSLKSGQWKQIGRCTFDINIMKPDKEQRVRKISKGKFEMLEIVINDFGKNPSGDREWKQFTF